LVDKPELVRDIIVVHLEVVFITETPMPMKDGEVDVLLQGRSPNFLHHWNPGDLLAAVQDHVKRLLVVAHATTKSEDWLSPLRTAAFMVPLTAFEAFPVFSS